MAWFIEFSVPRRVYTYIGLFDQAARSTVRRSHPLGRLFGFGPYLRDGARIAVIGTGL